MNFYLQDLDVEPHFWKSVVPDRYVATVIATYRGGRDFSNQLTNSIDKAIDWIVKYNKDIPRGILEKDLREKGFFIYESTIKINNESITTTYDVRIDGFVRIDNTDPNREVDDWQWVTPFRPEFYY